MSGRAVSVAVRGASAHPGWRRLLGHACFQLDRKLLRPRVLFETIDGRQVKRAVFASEEKAARVEDHLRRFGPTPHLPALVGRYGAEVVVEFVPGPIARKASHSTATLVGNFYGALYTREPHASTSRPGELMAGLDRDLDALRQAGLLSPEEAAGLSRTGERLAPAELWVGFDYSDPVPKNFVLRTGGPVCAVDIESLRGDRALGLGVAKACARWLDPFRDVLLDRIAAQGAPDIRPALPFLELCFAAQWTLKTLSKKPWRRENLAPFGRFLAA